MGLYDSPQTAEQPVFWLDYQSVNTAVFGEPLSGKTNLLKTIIKEITLQSNQKKLKENIYIIDFGGSLNSFSALPNVCACFNNRNEENIRRIFKTVDKELENKEVYLNGVSYRQAFESDPVNCPAHTLLIIENINSFLSDERYSYYQEEFLRLCREGISKGLSIIITGNDLSGLGRYLSNFKQRIAFEMPLDSYFELFNKKVNKPINIQGRGLLNNDSEVVEFQSFLPFAYSLSELGGFVNEKSEEEEYIRELVLSSSVNDYSNKLNSFPEKLTNENISEYSELVIKEDTGSVVIGLDYYDHLPVRIDFKRNRCIGIYGKRQFGKSNALRTIINGLKNNKEIRFVYFDDGREELKEYRQSDSSFESEFYFTDFQSFRTFLIANNYIETRDSKVSNSNPFTVFVMQSKSVYSSPEANSFMQGPFLNMINNAEALGYLFVFSDIRRFSDAETRTILNNSLSVALLLDSIGDFVKDKGSNSVFGELDAKELSSEYAKCSVGDGYHYDVLSDKITKLKFLLSPKTMRGVSYENN